MTSKGNNPENGFWLTTFLFAIPFGFIITMAGTAVFMEIAVLRSGEDANVDDYSGAFWSSIPIGMLIFFGFCYLIVPIAAFVLGLLRLTYRAIRARKQSRARDLSQPNPLHTTETSGPET